MNSSRGCEVGSMRHGESQALGSHAQLPETHSKRQNPVARGSVVVQDLSMCQKSESLKLGSDHSRT